MKHSVFGTPRQRASGLIKHFPDGEQCRADVIADRDGALNDLLGVDGFPERSGVVDIATGTLLQLREQHTRQSAWFFLVDVHLEFCCLRRQFTLRL